jgi:hypothetical protein
VRYGLVLGKGKREKGKGKREKQYLMVLRIAINKKTLI